MENQYDVIVVGGGPAGLSAALYMARAKYKVLVLEKKKFGGLITITSEVVNYPGVFHTSGEELTKEMVKQAQAFGAEFQLAEMTRFQKEGNFFHVHTDKGDVKALGLILATGAAPRSIGFKGEEDFKGRGVAYCATCDGEFFTDKVIYVIGSGFAACEESLFLTRFASHIHLLVRGKDFSCAGDVMDEVKHHPDITVHYETSTKEVYGENFVQGIRIAHKGKVEDIYDETGLGVFVFAGYSPDNEATGSQIALNEKNYIITDANQKTNVDGIYAAGDVCIKNLRQVVTAVSDGAIAATSLEKYLAEQYEALGLPKPKKGPANAKKPAPVKKEVAKEEEGAFLSADIRAQLAPVFARFEQAVQVHYALDERDISKEVSGFVGEMKTLSDKVTFHQDNALETPALPALSICNAEGKPYNVRFHGVPGGHEFNSFILGLYNAAGPGQAIGEDHVARIKALDKEIKLDLAVTLSCTNCPDLVMAAQRIALMNPKVSLDIYDLSQFEDLKNKHNIMSVPCMIVNDKTLSFGKKNLDEILAILEKE